MHKAVNPVDLFNNRLNDKIFILEQYNKYFPKLCSWSMAYYDFV